MSAARQRLGDPVPARACARRTCGTRGPARPAGARKARPGRARRSARPPPGEPRSSRRRGRGRGGGRRPGSRRGGSCIPTASKRSLSREPWKRSRRTRSASSASPVTTRPPSPRPKRFFVGKKLNVAADADGSGADTVRAGPEGLRRVLDDRNAVRQLVELRRPAEEVHREDRPRPLSHPRRHVLGVEVQGRRVDVAEDRRRADARDRLGGRVEREGRADDLVARARRRARPGRGRARRFRWRRRPPRAPRDTRPPPARTPSPRAPG